MDPNFEDLSCTMRFGVPPPPVEQVRLVQGFGAWRRAQHARRALARRALHSQAASRRLGHAALSSPRLRPRLPPLLPQDPVYNAPCFQTQCNLLNAPGGALSPPKSGEEPCPKIDTERRR